MTQSLIGIDMQTLNTIALELLLNAADSPRMYEPENSNYMRDYDDALALSRELAKVAGTSIIVEDPSIFQDGSILTRLLFESNGHAEARGVVLSAFGRLATICGIYEVEQVEAIESVLSTQGYTYVPYQSLNYPYSGAYKQFARLTWRERFFSGLYDSLDFVGFELI